MAIKKLSQKEIEMNWQALNDFLKTSQRDVEYQRSLHKEYYELRTIINKTP